MCTQESEPLSKHSNNWKWRNRQRRQVQCPVSGGDWDTTKQIFGELCDFDLVATIYIHQVGVNSQKARIKMAPICFGFLNPKEIRK